MPSNNSIDVSILENIIIGRVQPKIYAFSTRTVPNYLKVGDTYRPVQQRLNEWKKYFPNLVKRFESIAKVNDETFFRDHAIHFYLENDKQRSRLMPETFDSIPYYSKEFFENVTEQEIEDAIQDIKLNFTQNTSKYQFYNFDVSRVPITHTYDRIESFEPRPNQDTTIQKFREALENGRSNLLMYAVMRFGKSFTSMCCAVEMSAKLILIVSAKADVKEEWKKTVESHVKFEQYSFLDSNALLENETEISTKLTSGEGVVLFLTLQDLQGEEIKTRHSEVFSNLVDLLIIDETHFGARASEYGKVLKQYDFSNAQIKRELKQYDSPIDEAESSTKIIQSKVRIHLSGTPYRILMNSEFTEKDIIAFYQFSNISEDKKKWDYENLHLDNVKEWDNPYYGFPQMIRFAFNPNESSRRRMESLKSNGITYTFSELFKPKSIVKDRSGQLHKSFKYEEEVLELLKVIDGTETDENILSFLDYDKIKNGEMCRHIVCVLPFCASCDSLEELINNNVFKNLNSYHIINISGVDSGRTFRDSQSVKSKIAECERENIKTITLTVNRMLTGSTVPQWDTMLYLKDTASPQEYDQAIFRLQSQFIRDYKNSNGDILKFNMKPQTLLVDFNPNRMFQMQEHKSQIYNVNVESNGNSRLVERIQRELHISPIVVINNQKIVQVNPIDIINVVRKYSSERSVYDEASAISIDYSLLDIEEIKAEIERQGKLGSRQGIRVSPTEPEGEGDDLEIGEVPEEDSPLDEITEENAAIEDDDKSDYNGRFAMFYARILFFAFLTNSNVKSLQEVIEAINNNEDDIRISSNLGLDISILSLFQEHINPFILSELDYKIHNLNTLANDPTLSPIERAKNAMKKFSRLSDSEIVTPEFVTKKILNTLPRSEINNSTKLIDFCAKQGEFVYAVYKEFGENIARNFYSIPTSEVAYEFTRKVYSLLGLDTNNIESSYNSYQLIDENELIRENSILINNEYMRFDVIIGNPPYQQKEGGANENTAIPIYNHFVEIAKNLNPKYISLIIPTRWYAGGRGLDSFRNDMLGDVRISELHDFLKTELLFQNINVRGGICYFLWDSTYDNTKDLTLVHTYNDSLVPIVKRRTLKTEGSNIFIRHSIGVSIINKVSKSSSFESISEYISSAMAFGFRTFFINDARFRESPSELANPVICFGRRKAIGYVDATEVTRHPEWIDLWKVYIPESNNIGTELNDDNQNAFIGMPNTVCTETYLVVGAELSLNEITSKNLVKYLKTKFARFMHSLTKISQHGTSKTYKYVPLQNFDTNSDINWENSIEEIDKQLYLKYSLTDEEIDFVESMIKAME